MSIRILIFGLASVNCAVGQLTKERMTENIIQEDKIPKLEDDYDAMFTLRVALDDPQVVMGCVNGSATRIGDHQNPNAIMCTTGIELINHAQSPGYWSVIRITEEGPYKEPRSPIYGDHLVPAHIFTVTLLNRATTRPLGQVMHLHIQVHRSNFSEATCNPMRIQWKEIRFLSHNSPKLHESCLTVGRSIDRAFLTNDDEVANYTLNVINDLKQTVYSKNFEFFKTALIHVPYPEQYFSYTGSLPLESVSSEYLDQILGPTVSAVDPKTYFFQVNKSFIFHCAFHGYPFSWENAAVYWKPGNCTEEPCIQKVGTPGGHDPNVIQIYSTDLNVLFHRVRLLLVANQTGAYFCGYERNGTPPATTFSSTPRNFVVADSPDGTPVFAKRLQPSKLQIIEGQRILLQAIVNRFRYESPVWRTRKSGIEIGHPYEQNSRKTTLIEKGNSLIFELIIEYATLNDSDQYRCIARRRKRGTEEIFESNPVYINVKEGIRPYFGNKTDPKGDITNPKDSMRRFYCDAQGNPKPIVEWIKNGKPIDCTWEKCNGKMAIEEDGRQLTILNMESADSGRFMCRATSPLGVNQYEFTLSVDGTEVEEPDRRKRRILGISLTVAFLLAAALISFKYWRSHKAKVSIIISFYWYRTTFFLKESIPTEISELEEHLHQNLGNDQDVNDPGEAPRYYLEIPEENVVDGSKLGEGFFGKVYKSYMQIGESIKWQVATKYIKKSKHREQFKKEVKLMEKLPYHVNVVTLLGVVVSNRTCKMICAVLEYCDHGSLWDFIHMYTVQSSSSGQSITTGTDSMVSFGCQLSDEEAPESPGPQNESKDPKMTEYKDPILVEAAITEIVLLSFTYQIALGMAHLNRNDIFHGDVALRNMLLTKSLIVKVADFGCARREDSDIDKEGTVPWKWAAPETLKNGQLMRKSDVWSFGIAIHELYSDGKEPFQSIQSPNFLLNQLDHFPIHTLMPKPGKCPQEIYDLLLDCWILNEQDRPEFVQCHERINEFSLSIHSQNWEKILEHLQYISGRSEEHISNVKQLIRNWNEERLGNKNKDNVIPDQSC